MAPVRAFLAVAVPEEVHRRVLQLRNDLARRLPEVRWSNLKTLHLTLRFFGAIPEESLEKIGEVMLSIGRLRTPFQVELAGVGAFPSPARPRVFWLGVRQAEALTALHAAFERGLEAIGIPPEGRPYTPHLTLGRSRGPVRGAARVLEGFGEVSCGPLRVEAVTLFESRLQPAGAIHLPRRTVDLADSEPSPQRR